MNPEDILDYDDMIFLDAENLAEQGMATAYEEIREAFAQRGITLTPIEEHIDNKLGTYQVAHDGETYPIYTGMEDEDSWANATVALFDIVNAQLQNQALRLYAINGGNDLCGLIMTEDQQEQARQLLPNKTDWPYLPRAGEAWLGQPH